jgi:transcriptional regulator with XRE-family HTH domain
MLGVVFWSAFLLNLWGMPRVPQHRKILGETIRKYRKQTKMSQEKLAEKADLHPVYIGKVERGEQWISLHALLRVGKALGVRISELVADL